MEVRIKDNNGYVDADWTIEDGVMVVSPKEVKFEPKDGDIVTYMNGDKATIYVFAGGYKYNTSFYVAYSGLRNEVFKTSKGHLDMNRDDIRPATEEEKKKLFDKLAEKGYEWKPDTKELVELKWKPKYCEVYWTPYINNSVFVPIDCTWTKSDAGNDRYKKGWCFKTKEECQEFCNRLNNAINSVKP